MPLYSIRNLTMSQLPIELISFDGRGQKTMGTTTVPPNGSIRINMSVEDMESSPILLALLARGSISIGTVLTTLGEFTSAARSGTVSTVMGPTGYTGYFGFTGYTGVTGYTGMTGYTGISPPSLAYFSGGYTSTGVTTTDGLTFSTDTTTQVTKGVLTQARYTLAGANSSTLAYFSGGFSDDNATTTDGLTFSTDTTTQITKGVLTQARYDLAGAQSGSV